MDTSKYIGEAMAYDKKLMLERKEPLNWLKSIRGFANISGGVLLYGVDNDGNLVGLENAERDVDEICEMVKCMMVSVPGVEELRHLPDKSPIRLSRVFCTRWNGLTKSNGVMEALVDDAFEDRLPNLSDAEKDFVNVNAKAKWRKMGNGNSFGKILDAYQFKSEKLGRAIVGCMGSGDEAGRWCEKMRHES